MRKANNDLKILLIDTSPPVISKLEKMLNHLGYTACITAPPDKSIDKLGAMAPDLAVLGPSLDQESTIRCIYKLKIITLNMPIVVITGPRSPHSLSSLLNKGAMGNAEKGEDPGNSEKGNSKRESIISEGVLGGPFSDIMTVLGEAAAEVLSLCIEKVFTHRKENASRSDYPIMIGESLTIEKIRQRCREIAQKDVTVLITGETGTGKELIARSIHYHSERSREPLVKINCAALPEQLLESEVFGFQRGAFTGAHKDKPGRLELADRGTIFIDEIGALSHSLQVKFLQVLEDKEFTRLGGTQDKFIDARVVAATNADLKKMVREGSFRKDLFFRLNVMRMEAPPLRERKEDIPLLTYYFLNKYCYELRRKVFEIPVRVSRAFLSYNWPGNVRELENIVRRAIVPRNWDFVFEELKVDSQEIESQDFLSSAGFSPGLIWSDDTLKRLFQEGGFSLKRMSKVGSSEGERYAVLSALKETQWNRKKAAELLDVSYKTLLNRIEELGLKP